MAFMALNAAVVPTRLQPKISRIFPNLDLATLTTVLHVIPEGDKLCLCTSPLNCGSEWHLRPPPAWSPSRLSWGTPRILHLKGGQFSKQRSLKTAADIKLFFFTFISKYGTLTRKKSGLWQSGSGWILFYLWEELSFPLYFPPAFKNCSNIKL